MYIPSNFSSILWLGHHHQYWSYLVIFSFDLLTCQDSIFLTPSTELLFGSHPLFLVWVWVMLPPSPCNVARTDLFFYNLYRQAVSAIILASLGYFLVHSFADTMLWEYTIRTWENIQCVRTFPYNLHNMIHRTYGFSRANYTKQCIVRTDFPIKITRYDILYVRKSR